MSFGQGPMVRVVNRVVDENGNRVPQDARFGGEALVVRDTLDMPIGMARVVIHGSMYKIDPVTGSPSYRLGCEKLNCPIDDLPEKEVTRVELVERELLTESERAKMKLVRIHNPINPGLSRGPGAIRETAEGSQPGEFGFRS